MKSMVEMNEFVHLEMVIIEDFSLNIFIRRVFLYLFCQKLLGVSHYADYDKEKTFDRQILFKDK